MRIALAQTCPKLGALAFNCEETQRLVEAHRETSDFILFPELSLTGYGLGASCRSVAMRVDDPRLKALADSACGVTIQVGFVEEDSRFDRYNSVAWLRDGEVVHLHRKVNLPNYGRFEERKLFKAGARIDTAPVGSFQVAPLICADAWNPALVHLAAASGATLLAFSANSPTAGLGKSVSSSEGWKRLCRFYATIYGCYVAFVNRGGAEGETSFWGQSELIDPFGNVVCATEREDGAVLTAALDLSLCREARDILPTVRDDDPSLLRANLDVLIQKQINAPRLEERTRD